MINFQKIKKFLALTLIGILPMMCFALIITFITTNGLLYACIATALLFLVLLFITNQMLKHPLTQLIEGDGHLIMTNDSTGNKRLFIFNRITPFMNAQIDGNFVNQAFDRNLIQYLTAPITAKTEATMNEQGDITFTITKSEYNNAVQSFNNYRVIEYNTILKSVITKDFMKDKEATAFADYQIFNLYQHLKNMEGFLRQVFRNLGDEFNPRDNLSLAALMKKWWFWLIIIIFLGGIIYMMWPSIQNAIGGAAAPVTNIIKGNSNGIIQPVN